MTRIDKSDIIGTVFLDFMKAFDLGAHSLLIEILSLYKCNSTALNLLDFTKSSTSYSQWPGNSQTCLYKIRSTPRDKLRAYIVLNSHK